MLGTVTKYYKRPRNCTSPYGFILGSNGEEYYFDLRGIKSEIKIGDNVSFEGRSNEKGYYACEIKACNT